MRNSHKQAKWWAVLLGIGCALGIAGWAVSAQLDRNAGDDLAVVANSGTPGESVLPEIYNGSGAVRAMGLDPSTAQLIYSNGTDRAYFAQTSTGLSCLITQTGTGVRLAFGTSCDDRNASPPHVGTTQDTETSPILLTGLMPDGYISADLIRDGEVAATVELNGNVLYARVGPDDKPDAVRIQGPAGSRLITVY